MNTLRCMIILFLWLCVLTGCRPVAKVNLRYDEDVWKYRQPSTVAIPYADSSFRLYRVITVERPRDIYYSGLSFIQVTAQIAGAYHKRYLKFAAGIDTSQRGALGGGETRVAGPLSELLYNVTDGTLYSVYAWRDTLVITYKTGDKAQYIATPDYGTQTVTVFFASGDTMVQNPLLPPHQLMYVDHYLVERIVALKQRNINTVDNNHSEVTGRDTSYYFIDTRKSTCTSYLHFSKDALPQQRFKLSEKHVGITFNEEADTTNFPASFQLRDTLVDGARYKYFVENTSSLRQSTYFLDFNSPPGSV